MRLLIWGTVALCGLGLLIQLIGIHGSRDERAAIMRAVRAPFRDLRRRDARALCDDFTPAVAAELTARRGSCAAQVGRLFRHSAGDAEYVPPQSLLSRGRLEVETIHRQGARATADSVGPGMPGPVRHWALAFVHGRWRIATPATLRLAADCARRPFGASACLDLLSMRVGRSQ